MIDRQTVAPALAHLKIFPLPTAVLLPGAVIPLHIFEPRYRKLVADALATDRVVALAMFETGWEESYQGRPAVRPIVGVGQIHGEEQLPDGRFNLQLIGVARAEIIEELDVDQPYRVVRARFPVETTLAPEAPLEALRHALMGLLGSYPGQPSAALAHAGASLKDPGDLADLCVAALCGDAPTRQKALEMLDVTPRLALALDVVGDALARHKPSKSDEPTLLN
jgi:hypothetical protein